MHPPEDEVQQLSFVKREWKGAEGLAEDVRYYGKWMCDEAFKRIGNLYPTAKITAEIISERPDLKAQGLKSGDELNVIAWLWAHTVKCPNPACGIQMPLVRTFAESTRKTPNIWIEPIISGNPSKSVSYEIRVGKLKTNKGTVDRRGRCVCHVTLR